METERSYLASLKELQQEWLPAIRHALKKEKASLDELNSNLFNSIDLITQFNSTLMSELASVIEHWTPDKKVGDVFVKLVLTSYHILTHNFNPNIYHEDQSFVH